LFTSTAMGYTPILMPDFAAWCIIIESLFMQSTNATLESRNLEMGLRWMNAMRPALFAIPQPPSRVIFSLSLAIFSFCFRNAVCYLCFPLHRGRDLVFADSRACLSPGVVKHGLSSGLWSTIGRKMVIIRDSTSGRQLV
jgi:hypothetical protein